MSFDWQHFLEGNNIEFSTHGSNVSRGNIVVHCPFCAALDQGQHMSISLQGKGWYCFRNPEHSGKSPVRLVAALAGVSIRRAAELCGHSIFIPENFLDRVNSLLHPTQEPIKEVSIPSEFRHFSESVACRRFWGYLERRGYQRSRLMELLELFDIRYCLSGEWHDRIIFPVTFGGRLVTWTGRAISPHEGLRYKTVSSEKAEPISRYLLWYDQAMQEGKTIYLVEGPFDALRIWYLGRRHGVVATCFFTVRVSEQQIELLHELLPRFRHRYLLLDRNTMHIAIRYQAKLAALNVQVRTLPEGIKDPGELPDAKFLAQSP